ncbi:MAG: GGDEF domain-containing protein [Pseudomonadota bacterium]
MLAVLLATLPVFALALATHMRTSRNLETMTHTAMTDQMTGLLNRRGFVEKVADLDDGVLLIIDIDHFKHVNDRYGHAAGDAVLRSMSAHLKVGIRKSDVVGRLGGEEFAIYLRGVDSQFIDQIGERLCRGFVLYNEDVPAPIKVTMSVGAAFSAMAGSKSDIYFRADQALYHSKRSGRARLSFWQPPLKSRF